MAVFDFAVTASPPAFNSSHCLRRFLQRSPKKFDSTIALQGDVDVTIGGRTSVENLAIKSGTIEAEGNVSLENDALSANLKGKFPALEKLTPQAKGVADFTIEASGALAALTSM